MDKTTLPAGRRLRRGPLLLVAPVLAAFVLSGCSGGSQSAGSTDAPAGSAGNVQQNSADLGVAQSAPRAAASVADENTGADVQQRAVISTGHIELTSGDVATTRTRLDAVLGDEGGHVADENTVTDNRGVVTRSHLVVRVPSNRFDDAMTSLAGTASLRSSSRKAEDVTTEVIDLGARIAAERAGVRRLRHLVSTTADLRALLDVERALTARQGELESLQQQQTYLADRASLATITVDVTRRTAPAPAPAKATGGFLGGLSHGWHGLVAVVTGLLVGLGATLPFAVALALVGIPAWLVARRLRRVRRPRTPVEPA
jgi:outer membrane murein-binding lipoprotein Lpp